MPDGDAEQLNPWVVQSLGHPIDWQRWVYAKAHAQWKLFRSQVIFGVEPAEVPATYWEAEAVVTYMQLPMLPPPVQADMLASLQRLGQARQLWPRMSHEQRLELRARWAQELKIPLVPSHIDRFKSAEPLESKVERLKRELAAAEQQRDGAAVQRIVLELDQAMGTLRSQAKTLSDTSLEDHQARSDAWARMGGGNIRRY